MRKHTFLLPMSSFKRQREGANGGNFNCSVIPVMSEHPVWPGPRACPIKVTELRTKESKPHITLQFSGGGRPASCCVPGWLGIVSMLKNTPPRSFPALRYLKVS